MKRIVAIFLIAMVLVTVMAVPTMAASSFFLQGPDMVRAGDTITVTFYGGNLYKGAFNGSGTMVYDSEQVTLLGYTPLMEGDWSVVFFGDSFSFSSKSNSPLLDNVPIFSAQFQLKEDLATGSVVRIAVDQVVMNNGEYDISLGGETWWRIVVEPLSANADLSSLVAESFHLSPSFDPEQLHYAVYLPNEVQSVRLIAKVADYRSAVSVPTLEDIPLGKTTYEITVTAQNGDVKVYTVTTYRADPVQDPYQLPEETEPVTQPDTEPTEEPTTEPTEEPTTAPNTQPTMMPAGTASTQQTSSGGMSKTTTGLLWILSIVAAFIGGIITPIILGYRE